jgi:dTDP-4-amino-4,6-dideoxygalactose transaminase
MTTDNFTEAQQENTPRIGGQRGMPGSATDAALPSFSTPMPTPMTDVPTSDLAAEHAPLLAELEAAARRVIRSNRFILGPEVAAFERELAAAHGVARAVAVSSGSDALIALLMAHGVGPGDEVLTTPFSFFASVEAIVRVGAHPLFADVEGDTLNLDPDDALRRIGPHTKAVLVVHLFGRAARTEALEAHCARQGIPLLEDAAQAIGSRQGVAGRRRPVGAIGRAGALSFYPSKNLGGFGDGGAIVTDDEALADRIALLRTHGASERFHHVAIGGNFRMDELQAALLRVKLPHLPAWTERRRRIAARYQERLASLPMRLPPADRGCVWNQYVVRVSDGQRDRLSTHLRGAGIETSIYYPVPLHLQPALAALGGRPGQFPRAEKAAEEVLGLPIYPELSDETVDRVCGALHAFFQDRTVANPVIRR